MVLFLRFLMVVCLFMLCNAPILALSPAPIVLLAVSYLLVQIKPDWDNKKDVPRRLRVMIGGYELFLTSAWFLLAQTAFGLWLLLRPEHIGGIGLSALLWALFLTLVLTFLLLCNGFFRIIFTSVRLRLVLRLLLIFFWWCPVVNLVLLHRACKLVKAEYRFELARLELNDFRRENEVCRTKYPIILVHGIFFRDWQLVNYWGRIPKELVRNGAEIYYGSQQSAAAVAQSAVELKETVLKVLKETGSEKVNLIAHSKGGLDARYAISRLGLDKYVASLTTINTPHRGCIFAQALMDRLPDALIQWIARKYNALFHTLGDAAPDFLAGVTDLRADVCARFNAETPDREGVLYQSVMSTMKKARSAPAPLNFTYLLVKKYDKELNDGLVALSSAPWGSFLGNLTAPGRRGISHGDIIDLMREDIDGFDVREFYVGLVKDLKARGL